MQYSVQTTPKLRMKARLNQTEYQTAESTLFVASGQRTGATLPPILLLISCLPQTPGLYLWNTFA